MERKKTLREECTDWLSYIGWLFAHFYMITRKTLRSEKSLILIAGLITIIDFFSRKGNTWVLFVITLLIYMIWDRKRGIYKSWWRIYDGWYKKIIEKILREKNIKPPESQPPSSAMNGPLEKSEIKETTPQPEQKE